MSAPSFSDLSVLIVEDEPSLNDLLEAFLLQIGVKEISKAHNGEEALVKLRLGEIKPDIILCDLRMPVMDGIEFLGVLRGEKGLDRSNTPVLILTGNNEEESITKVAELGIQGYLIKPVSIEELSKRMTLALAKT